MPDTELQSKDVLDRRTPYGEPELRDWECRLPAAIGVSGPTQAKRRRARAVLQVIAPRLLQTLNDVEVATLRQSEKPPKPAISTPDVGQFLVSTRIGADEAWRQLLAYAFDGGVGISEILEAVVAPAARRLGDLWACDECDFLDVTIAVAHMQMAVRRLAQTFTPERSGGRTALFAAAPGETHVLGLEMVRAYFESQGWSAEIIDHARLDAAVGERRFDVVGFSISCSRYVDALAPAIGRIRRRSKNADICVLVGGPVVRSDRLFGSRVGADAQAQTPQDAVVIARSFLRRRAPM